MVIDRCGLGSKFDIGSQFSSFSGLENHVLVVIFVLYISGFSCSFVYSLWVFLKESLESKQFCLLGADLVSLLLKQ